MRNFIGDSISGLISDLKEHIKTFIRQELELAKKEMAEKTSTYVRKSVTLAVGGCMAYAGLIVFLAGLGLIIGFAFQRLGLSTTLAAFIGLGIIGLLASAVGGLMVRQGIKAISATAPVPEKTIETAKEVTGANRMPTSNSQRIEDPRSSDEIHESAQETAEHVESEKEELAFQLSPRQLKERAVHHMKEHPLMWTAAALGGAATVATSGVLFGRKFLTRVGIQAGKLLTHRTLRR